MNYWCTVGQAPAWSPAWGLAWGPAWGLALGPAMLILHNEVRTNTPWQELSASVSLHLRLAGLPQGWGDVSG